jgi:hypothetical protein
MAKVRFEVSMSVDGFIAPSTAEAPPQRGGAIPLLGSRVLFESLREPVHPALAGGVGG